MSVWSKDQYMLLSLSLRDFVIVDQLDLNFGQGFTVLTGETGAGKSIMLDALGLLMGDKAEAALVRYGSKEANLSALFDIEALPSLQQQLQEQGLLREGETELSIRRVLDANGKSRSFINSFAVTLGQLKVIGEQLIDIHGQNTHQSLNREATQRYLLDAFASALDLAKEVKQAFSAWQGARVALTEAATKSEQLEMECERLSWQINELSELNLSIEEWSELSQSHHTLAHAAELIEAAYFVENALMEDQQNMLKSIALCQNRLSHLVSVYPEFNQSIELLNSVEVELGEVSHNMRAVINAVEVDPAELALADARIHEVMSMARKYRVEAEELPESLLNLKEELSQLEAATNLEAFQAACIEKEQAYFVLAKELGAKRASAAKKLSLETTKHLQELAMSGVTFDVSLLPSTSPQSYGLEGVSYQVAANQGVPLRPINKVASGGELSRISLAIQVVVSQYTEVPTLIFDEVDAGIGGRVAQIVGKLLRTLGARYQVLAITHLPQVAACGQEHWQVSKRVENKQTISCIQVLDEVSRIDEVARMLGGEVLTDTTKAHARELLKL